MAKRIKPTGIVAGGALIGVGATLALGLGPSAASSSGSVELAKASTGSATNTRVTPGKATAPTPAAVEVKPAAASTPAPKASAAPASVADGSYTGDSSAAGRYGLIQVKVTIAGGKLSDVQILQYPSNDRQSIMINQYALPRLIQDAISVQSASVSNISGASYTSRAFASSLQSALAQAGL